jgi:hypothetical protein
MANYDLGIAVGGTNQQIADAIKGVVDSGQTSSQIANMLQNPIANDALPPYVFTSIENMQIGHTVNGLYVNDYLTVGQSIKLTDATRQGDFTVRLAAGYTTEIAADTLMGVYIPITGTDYVAVRECNVILLRFFPLVEADVYTEVRTVGTNTYTVEQCTSGVGTDIYIIFNLASITGKKLYLDGGGYYCVRTDIRIWDNIHVDGDNTVKIFTDFSSTGHVAIRTSLSKSSYTNVFLNGFTVHRCGTYGEHGVLIDAIHGLKGRIKVTSDSDALGGACSVSSIFPYKRPSKNCNFICDVEYGGNFGLQLGAIEAGYFEVISQGTHRETLGLEPVAQNVFFDVVINSDDSITIESHNMVTGDALYYSNEGNTSYTGLTEGVHLFVIKIDDDNFYLAETKHQAFAGANITGMYGTSTGSHVLIFCSTMKQVTAKVTSTTRDVAAKGSLTGNVVIVGVSGGYFEDVICEAPAVDDSNDESGSYGLGCYGAKNILITNPRLAGPTTSLVITNGHINDVPYNLGGGSTASYFTPVGGISVSSDIRVAGDMDLYGFSGYGLKVIGTGSKLVTNGGGKVHSEDGTHGIYIDASASASGNEIRNLEVDVPNGVVTNLLTGLHNIKDANSNKVISYSKVRLGQMSNKISVTGDGTKYTLGTLYNASGAGQLTYSGKIIIVAKNVDYDNANVAMYEAAIVKAYSGATTTLTLLSSAGLVSGVGSSFPSFTFSVTGNSLIATPIASTSTSGTFVFEFEISGNLSTGG